VTTTRDMRELARACQVLLDLAGIDEQGHSLWTEKGPSRRASWLKGYLRRPAPPADGVHPSGHMQRPSPLDRLGRRDRLMLLVAFDLWNGSGGALLGEVLGMSPRLVTAVAGFMEARCQETPGALETWVRRWSPQRPR
jgi:hypothetical protein